MSEIVIWQTYIVLKSKHSKNNQCSNPLENPVFFFVTYIANPHEVFHKNKTDENNNQKETG